MGLPALVVACLVLAGCSLLVPVQITHDPLAWLVWGRDVARLDLDTRGMGPAWKPLPVLVSTGLSALGDLAPAAWLLVARAGGLLAVGLAYRLAASVAGWGAGLVAALVLLTSAGWIGELLLPGMSEPLLAALALLAVDRHRHGRPGAALAALLAAALLRPEAWPFLGAYGLLLWVRRPRWRPVLAAAAVAVPLLWFGAEWWGSGDPLRSSRRAGVPTEGGPLLTAHPGLGVLASMGGYLVPAAWPAILVAALPARRPWRLPEGRADRLAAATLLLAAGWVGVVTALTVAGSSAGDQRYLVVAAALLAVAAGIGAQRAYESASRLRGAGSRGRRRRAPVALLVVLAIAVAGVIGVLLRAGEAAGQIRSNSAQDESPHTLTAAVRQAGGAAALRGCGTPATGPYEVPLVAWVLGTSLPDVHHDVAVPGAVLRSRSEPYGRPAAPPSFRPVPLDGEAARDWAILVNC